MICWEGEHLRLAVLAMLLLALYLGGGDRSKIATPLTRSAQHSSPPRPHPTPAPALPRHLPTPAPTPPCYQPTQALAPPRHHRISVLAGYVYLLFHMLPKHGFDAPLASKLFGFVYLRFKRKWCVWSLLCLC